MLDSIYQHIQIQSLAWAVILLPLAAAAVNGLIAMATASVQTERARPWVSFIGTLLPILSFAAAIVITVTISGLEKTQPSFITGPLFSWAITKGLVVDVGLKIDQLSMVMMLVVTGVGSLIHIYSIGYMAHDSGHARYFSLLNLFLFFMLIIVLADNLLVVFAGWEGVGLCSYLLIGFWFEDEEKARAGTKAFIVNRIGDVGFLVALFLTFGVMAAANAPHEIGYFNIDNMQQHAAWFLPIATIVCLAFFLGACGKSAQIPLYVWLPDAMAGPTPVSALIHAATMVAAGVYLIARLNFLYILSPIALQVIATVGACTAIFAAVIGMVQTDLKKILAYSTISQLGFMFLAAGVGAFSVAIFHLATHAAFKALLFLGAGAVIQAMRGEHDIRNFGALRERMPVTAWCFVIGAAALAGIAPTAGFVSKDAILWQTFERGHYILWIMAFATVGLTSFYIFRAVGMTFFGEPNAPVDDFRKATEPSLSMVIPTMVLAAFALLGGIFGWPEVLGGSNRIVAWLNEIMAYERGHAPATSAGREMILMAITLLWSIHFSIIGWVIYAQKRNLPERMAKRFARLHRVVLRKFYVDEIYNAIFVKPIQWISGRILWKEVDETYLDGLCVHGTARAVGFWSSLVSALQTGLVQNYLIYFLIGASIIVGIAIL
jgi:NADH-quinone oxidoreductase subunit L